jgi:DNA-directed RNA polymerase specialized sigma subunit
MFSALDEFIKYDNGIEKRSAADRTQKDLQLWTKWRDNGKQPEHTEELLNNFSGIINKSANRFAALKDIPKSAVKAEFHIQAMKAFETYDPNKAALSTHLTNQLRRGDRFVHTYQNIGRVVESRIYKITQYKNDRALLEDKLGRPASSQELADHLKWPVKQVVAMENEVRGQLPASRSSMEHLVVKPSKDAEVLRLIPYELTGEEKIVFEYTYGLNGKPQLTPGQMSTTLNISQSKISRLKSAIASKIEKYR